MKLSVLFISSILTLVTATPLVLSRAPSHPFKLLADGVNLPETLFPPLQVEGDTGTGFFRFGWFNLGGHEPDLFFPEDFSIAGTVLDDRKNGFEIVLVPVFISGEPDVYQLLLADPHSTTIEPTRHFLVTGGDFLYKSDIEPLGYWFVCETTPNEIEVFFGAYIPQSCYHGRSITLHPFGNGWN